MSKQSILIIRPVMNKYDDYGRELYEVLSFSMGAYIKWESLKIGYKIIDLAGREATRDAFESAIKLYEDRYCSFFGAWEFFWRCFIERRKRQDR